jgi:hypothetical protein
MSDFLRKMVKIDPILGAYLHTQKNGQIGFFIFRHFSPILGNPQNRLFHSFLKEPFCCSETMRAYLCVLCVTYQKVTP